jgi:hypothetical protein
MKAALLQEAAAKQEEARLAAEEQQMRAVQTAPKPTVEQMRAIRTALEKFTGRGQWGSHAGYILPPFELRLDDPELPPGKAGVVFLTKGGAIVMLVRVERRQPEDIHRTVLHELQHVFDAHRFGELSVAALEERAENTAERLSALR